MCVAGGGGGGGGVEVWVAGAVRVLKKVKWTSFGAIK